MPQCPLCNKTYAGASGLHYHRVHNHGHVPRYRKKRKKTKKIPLASPPPAAPPLTAPPPPAKDSDLLIFREGLQFSIRSVRTDDLRYVSALSDFDAERGAFEALWEYEREVPHMPARWYDPTNVVSV